MHYEVATDIFGIFAEEDIPCDDVCAIHTSDCDGHCDHDPDTHRNACVEEAA